MNFQPTSSVLCNEPRVVAEQVLDLATAHNLHMLRSYVATLSHDPEAIDDLTQEVFLRAIERRDRLHNPSKTGAFLRGIARHVVQEHFRTRARDKSQVHDAALGMVIGGDSPDIACHQRLMLSALNSAIAVLPIVSRRLIEMRYGQGMAAREIGREMNIRPTAVRVSLLRIRDRLKRDIKRQLRNADQF